MHVNIHQLVEHTFENVKKKTWINSQVLYYIDSFHLEVYRLILYPPGNLVGETGRNQRHQQDHRISAGISRLFQGQGAGLILGEVSRTGYVHDWKKLYKDIIGQGTL